MDNKNFTDRGVAGQEHARLVWRGSTPLIAISEGNVTTLYRVTLVPDARHDDPLGRLLMIRDDLFEALAPINGADAVSDLFADFDQMIADLREELA